MPSERERRFVGPRRGQLIFAVGFVGLSVLLISQITTQTQWVEKSKFFAQPRFWPAVGILGMLALAGLHLYRLPWWRNTRYDWWEARKWLTVLEYTGWFMGYVLLVPVLGYLPVTLVFVPALAWRMGYRDKQMMWISVGFAFAVVILFKSLLGVKIPGGAIYEYLPGALRSFFILYL
ncbi:tripartite tricarboxylate transporter TctB family protein [Ruegeria sp. 2205SS24-7]|uniref:tripartite tricarboxylate transporter TctB family protein n=1 Tax=Ruegeria discodermiae TaxID=3064389 RepID=UPI0027411552|nr:tripartite tricarboxylate transporter TctB family protein [Ruegeria sp. 2205SS24-7]MDP5218605.1 tripartite tricarboxylate transporter TctB family protein [Ruegeria sp. 2205SS24-7]